MTESYLGAINKALHELCKENDLVYVLGEDIEDPYSGAFKATKGLSSLYPERVLSTPISEAAIIGMAGGMAMRGLLPIVEIMFGDFILLGMDQIVNHICKYSGMYAGQVKTPIIIRTPMGGGRGYGPVHSQSLEKHFLGIPNLKVIAPSHFHNPRTLLKNTVKGAMPVLFIENKRLYSKKLKSPLDISEPLKLIMDGDTEYPVAVLSNFNEGKSDVVIITYGGMTEYLDKLLLRLFDEEINVSCVIPSILNQIDITLLVKYVNDAEAGCIVLEEGTSGFNWGSEIVAQMQGIIQNKKINRLASDITLIPTARYLESQVIPGLKDIENAVIELVEEKFSKERL